MSNKGHQKRTRPPLSRMFRIHELMRDKKFPSAPQIAREFEVTPLTCKRDFAFMQDQWKLPMAYDHSRHGWYYTAPADHLFAQHTSISEKELFLHVIVRKIVELFRGTPLELPAMLIVQKIEQYLTTEARYSLQNLHDIHTVNPLNERILATFHTIDTAMEKKRVIWCMYRRHNSTEVSERFLGPIHSFSSDGRWYLIAEDLKKKEIKTYVLSRMSEVKITKEKYRKPGLEKFNPEEYLRNCFRAMGGNEKYDVVIRFDRWSTDIVFDRVWHSSQQLEIQPDGSSIMKLHLNSLEEVEGFVLSHGAHAEVLEPPALRERVAKTVGELARKYVPPAG